jgi:hypothetical protein
MPDSDEEYLARLRKRAELKDPFALCDMALSYGYGRFGLPVDQAKCIDLLRESAVLGHPPALNQLGNFHHHGNLGLEQNEDEALKYYEKAAEGGNILARDSLACAEYENGDDVAEMRHLRLAASGGYRRSMVRLIMCFEKYGLLRHGDLAETLQAFYRSKAERKSNDRDHYIEHLKKTGHYKALYED